MACCMTQMRELYIKYIIHKYLRVVFKVILKEIIL